MKKRVFVNQSKPPKSFEELNRLHPLYTIHDEVAYSNAQEIVDALAILDCRTDGQEAYLESLVILMEAYEREHHAIDGSGISPVEVLKYMLDQHDMNASDLGRLLGNRSVGSAILRGTRQLSKRHIQKISAHFGVLPHVFLEKVE